VTAVSSQVGDCQEKQLKDQRKNAGISKLRADSFFFGAHNYISAGLIHSLAERRSLREAFYSLHPEFVFCKNTHIQGLTPFTDPIYQLFIPIYQKLAFVISGVLCTVGAAHE
jgi:hypothetical protein